MTHNIVWTHQRETSKKGRRWVDGALYHQCESCRRFCLFAPRGDKKWRKRSDEWGRLKPKMPASHSASIFFACSPAPGGENRAHTVCRIYSKASRDFARCTERKLSCRPEINYRVSRGWIRNVLCSTITTALWVAANRNTIHRSRVPDERIFQLAGYLITVFNDH